jgi:hypothetical protein
MTKTFKDNQLFRFSNFGHWDLFEYLGFGISTNITINRADPLKGQPKPALWARILYLWLWIISIKLLSTLLPA